MPSTRSDINEHGVSGTPSNAAEPAEPAEPAETATAMMAAEGAEDEMHQIERTLQLVGAGPGEEGDGGGMEGHFRASNLAPLVFIYATAFVLLLLRVLLLRAYN